MCDIMKFYISCSLVINGNKVFYSLHCDPVRLHLLRKTCWIDSTLGSPGLTVRLNAYTLYIAYCTGSNHAKFRVSEPCIHRVSHIILDRQWI